MAEWKTLAHTEARCESAKETLAFLSWAISGARKLGREVNYARHCLPEAVRWGEVREAKGFGRASA